MGRFLKIAGWTVGLAAGIGLGLLYHKRHSIAERLDRRPGGSKTVSTSFGTVEYATAGAGSPLLVSHGAGGGFDQGLHLTAALAGKGYYLIAPSRFGYLGSDIPEIASPAAQADAYAKLLDQLGIRYTVVLGISAGAWSALHFALRYPARCRALVLLAPATTLPMGTRMYGGLVARTLFRSNLAGWIMVRLAAAFPQLGAELLGTPASVLENASPEEKQRLRQVLLDSLPVRAHAAGMKLDIDAAHSDQGFAMKKIACPVLTIAAEDDAFHTAAQARDIAKAVRGGKVVVFPTGGHLLVDRQEDVVAEVLEFLKASSAARD